MTHMRHDGFNIPMAGRQLRHQLNGQAAEAFVAVEFDIFADRHQSGRALT